MHNISMSQALALWSQLEQAYYNDNSFGGDTAEVYLYAVTPYCPAVASNAKGGGIIGEIVDDHFRKANESLYAILAKFAHDRETTITVNGRELGEWLQTANFQHRVHVQVIRGLTS